MNKRQIREAMYEADRERARIAYRGCNAEMSDKQFDRILAKNRATDGYKAADARFRELSACLNDNRGPEALAKMFRL